MTESRKLNSDGSGMDPETRLNPTIFHDDEDADTYEGSGHNARYEKNPDTGGKKLNLTS